jgi:hypothetical protein
LKRYDLLSIIGATGIAAWYIRNERHRSLVALWLELIAAWPGSTSVPHVKMWGEYLTHTPVGVKHLIIRELEAQGIGIEVTDRAKSLLVDRGYDATLGARPLRRALQRLVEDPLSEQLLYKKFRAGEIVIVDAEPDPESPKGEDMIVFRSVEGFEPPTVELAEAGPAD